MLYISISIGSMLYIVRLHSHIPNEYLTTVIADEVVIPVCSGLVLMHDRPVPLRMLDPFLCMGNLLPDYFHHTNQHCHRSHVQAYHDRI